MSDFLFATGIENSYPVIAAGVRVDDMDNCGHHARYPWVTHWTPVNEVLVTTLFSARYGWWNERLRSDAAFVRATLNACRATLLAMEAIRARVPNAVFVQSESLEYTHPAGPDLG